MLVDDGLLRRSEDGWVPDRRHLEHRDPSDDPRAPHRAPGSPAGRRARRRRPRFRRRPRLRVAGAWQSSRRPDEQAGLTGCLHSLIRKELLQPEFAEAERGGLLPLRAHPHPRRRLRRAAQARARRRARAARRLDRGARDRADRGVRGDRRLPPRAGATGCRSSSCRSTQRSRLAGRRALPASWPSTGRRAYARGDMPAAVNLLSRATAPAGRRGAGAGRAAAAARLRAARDRRLRDAAGRRRGDDARR